MTDTLNNLLSELEELSAKAVDQATAGELEAAAHTIFQRSAAVVGLQRVLAAAEPVSYTEWNRLAVIHFQGNRIHDMLLAARGQLAAELVESTRGQALLECVSGVVGESTPPARLSEHA